MALENPQGLDWLDLTFGQLDGWWRFVDDHRRSQHALVSTAIWRSALEDTGFPEIEFLGPERDSPDQMAERVVIVARGPSEVLEPAGTWVIAGDQGSVGEESGRGTGISQPDCGARRSGVAVSQSIKWNKNQSYTGSGGCDESRVVEFFAPVSAR